MKEINNVDNWDEVTFYIDVNDDGLLTEDERAEFVKTQVQATAYVNPADQNNYTDSSLYAFTFGDILDSLYTDHQDIYSASQIWVNLMFKVVG